MQDVTVLNYFLVCIWVDVSDIDNSVCMGRRVIDNIIYLSNYINSLMLNKHELKSKKIMLYIYIYIFIYYVCVHSTFSVNIFY